MTKRRPGRMAKLGNKVFKKTEGDLADEELELLAETSIDWEELRPKVGDSDIYDQLISEVQEATRNNESLSQLKNRLQKLGEGGMKLAGKIIEIVKEVV